MTIFSSVTVESSYARKLRGAYVPMLGDPAPKPQVLRVNEAVAVQLGLDPVQLGHEEAALHLTGSKAIDGAESLAMVYAGHQFGGFSPQLGDGRALLLGEIVTADAKRYDLHLKGSGPTPFSRGGDGKAALGPVLREYLMGEAMAALGVPTTRALAVCVTGEEVWRAQGMQKAAVLARVAASHLRVGSFEFFARQGQYEMLKKLADYTIWRHFPQHAAAASPYLELFKTVRDAQAALVAKWVSVGFVHGVMNTDNVAISGETIDYGPCAFIDTYDPKAVFSSIDEQGRYAYGQQPIMAQWNLMRFAESLMPLLALENKQAQSKRTDQEIAEVFTAEIHAFPQLYQEAWGGQMRPKFGFNDPQKGDLELMNAAHELMAQKGLDFTLFFQSLPSVFLNEGQQYYELFKGDVSDEARAWASRYAERIASEGLELNMIFAKMQQVNPVYIPRNHLVEAALLQAENGDMTDFDALLERVSHPYQGVDGSEHFGQPAPNGHPAHVTFCGT